MVNFIDNTGAFDLPLNRRLQWRRIYRQQETITGEEPYGGLSDLKVINLVALKNEIPQHPQLLIPSSRQQGEELWRLLKSCWEYTPEARPKSYDVWNTVGGPIQCGSFDKSSDISLIDEGNISRQAGREKNWRA